MDNNDIKSTGTAISNAYTSDKATEYEAMRKKVFSKMAVFSQMTHGICEYEMVYDEANDDIKVIKNKDKPKQDRIYFKSRNDAYACILAAGESNIKKYYFGGNR
jgi:hypothetical protein